MSTVQVEALTFTFAPNVDPHQYERAGQNVHGWPPGSSVVDVVAYDPTTQTETLWLIEAKDYRVITTPPQPSKLANLPQTIQKKVEHTLRSLPEVAATSNDSSAAAHATKAHNTPHRRVVLHLEPYPPGGPHDAQFMGLERRVLQKLEQLVSHIDPHPLVLSIATTSRARVPWQVR